MCEPSFSHAAISDYMINDKSIYSTSCVEKHRRLLLCAKKFKTNLSSIWDAIQ